jgi:hypothetical protein
MKKLVLALALLTTTTVASAHGWEGYGYRGGYYHSHSGDWIAPAVIGGIVGYAIAQPRTVYVQPQPQVIYNNSVQGICPTPYMPTYNLVWVYDAYGRAYQTEQFVGCR